MREFRSRGPIPVATIRAQLVLLLQSGPASWASRTSELDDWCLEIALFWDFQLLENGVFQLLALVVVVEALNSIFPKVPNA